MTALKLLQELDYNNKRELYKNMPEHAIPKRKYSDTTTNALTESVLRFLTIKNHYASRIQSQGQWNEKIGRFTKSTVRRGIGDIMAIIDGLTVMIEIKVGRDRQSKYQVTTEKDVKSSGGLYWTIKDFESFYNQYQQLTTKQK